MNLGKKKIQQAGGARVDCDEKSRVAGTPGCESISRELTFWAETVVCDGCGYAHCEVFTPRQQSWLQLLAPLTVSCSDTNDAEP
ncbi:MAG: hypothetical protein ABSG34_15155 [Candidatus Sulfotelmatobacter sp.]